MKKTLIAVAALGAMAGVAQAQSTVTLYGVVDANVFSQKNNSVTYVPATNSFRADSLTQRGVGSGGQNGSRWGLRVAEDLGGGLKAVAVIEAGLNADTGTAAQGGTIYGRQVFGGLSGGFGTVSLGRQYSAYDDVKGLVSVQGNNAYDVSLGYAAYSVPALAAAGTTPAQPAATIALLDAPTTAANGVNQARLLNAATAGVGAWVGYDNARVNNSIKYQSPSLAGFSLAGVYGFGENKTITTKATKDTSFNLKYANGPITGTLAYQQNEFSRDFKLKNTLLGGAYDLGVAKLFAQFNRAKFTNVEKQNEFALGVAVPVGAFTVVGQVARSKGDDLGKNTGYGLEAYYDLSKRTRTYVSLASTKKELLNDERNSIVAAGLRHSF
jgi:predicted porin